MATTVDFIEYVCEQARDSGAVRYKKMFGEYMMYVNDKPILLVCDNTVFVKILLCLDALMATAERGFPYDGAKEHYVLDIEDRELSLAVIAALEEVTPLPKPRAKKQATSASSDPIGEYIAAQDEAIQPRLREVYAAIKAVLPDATEKISYGMPTFWSGRNIFYFAANKKHIGLYPGGWATTVFADKLTDYKTSKGAIQLPHDKPLPLGLIAEIAEWCGRNNGK